ncbi:MAG: TIGR01777 family oxidoreductase [Microscillaceae bacterium]
MGMILPTLFTGGTGLIGRQIIDLLKAKNYPLRNLSRQAATLAGVEHFAWDTTRHQLDPKALVGTGAIIHLAGAGVADSRWTEARKKEILDSRVHATRLLAESLKNHPHSVKTLVAASAIGFYGGDKGAAWCDENTPPGSDFLAQVTQAWEAEVDTLAELGLRVVKLRIGIVLSREGGALPKLVQPIRYGAGAALGSGQQYLAWIHIRDLARMFVYALENEALTGTYNAVGPDPVTNAQMTKEAARVLQRPLLLPNVPAFALRLMLGEMAEMVLGGCRVRNDKMMQAGFQYDFPHLPGALEDLLKPH